MLRLPPLLDALLAHGEAVASRLEAAARTKPEEYPYGWRTVRDVVQLAGSGATLWLLWNRKRAALPLSVATAAATAGLTALSCAFDPAPGPAPKPTLREKVAAGVADVLPNALGALALATSPDARHELARTLDLAPRDPRLPFGPWERARNLASLYAAYTVVGHWAEMAFCQLIRLGVVDGDYDRSNTMLWDWWLHPFPAEGVAGVLIALFLSPLRERLLARTGGRVLPALVVSFLANQAVCTSVDYLTGMVANRNYELWDYRDMPFNFQGQVCLQNSLVYSAAATLVAWLAYPARDRWLRTVPDEAADLAFSALAPTYALLCLTYFV